MTAPHIIKIKRSTNNNVVPYLGPGELAYTQSGNSLFIGAPDTTSGNIRIGHKLHDGILTANEALVANSSLGIDRILAANVDIGNILHANGSPGEIGSILVSAGYNSNTYWAPLSSPYYYSTQMYDYTEYGLGWTTIAPNQNAETLGFRFDITPISFGAIWLLATNEGDVDEPPITIYSPSTLVTPMMWISIDGSGPYDPVLNPDGQAYWLNITPPPATL